jgi:predicted glutamine amidotransferase
MLSRQCCCESDAFKAEGVSVAGGYQEVVLFASVPLSDESWRPLAEGEVVAVSFGKPAL